MRKTMEKMKEKKAITLIALVVTIAVILILAGITVGMVTSDNGVLKETKNAKTLAEIDNEKSIVERAKMLTMMRDKSGKITLAVFEPALKDEAGTNPTDVSDAGDVIEVLFTNSNRYYEIDQDGNVSEPQEIIKDEYAGDITKGGRCDGSEKKPYEINCIEDLVALSNIVNGEGIKFENGQLVQITESDGLDGKNIILVRNLNFKSKYSYADSTRTDFGNINGNDTDGNMLITEMTIGTGFVSIGYNINKIFSADFDGKKNTISNIMINNTERNIKDGGEGLFGNVNNSIIKNLIISGNINGGAQIAGGISGQMLKNSKIINCTNKCNIKSGGTSGGIIGRSFRGEKSTKLINCVNIGNVENQEPYGEYGSVGGIIGGCDSVTSIINCYNQGTIRNNSKRVYSGAGGIMGNSGTQIAQIYNCYNIGNSTAENTEGSILGGYWYSNWISIIKNCYYLKDSSKYVIGKAVTTQEFDATECTREEMQSTEIINKLNEYVEIYNQKNKDNEDFVELKYWKKGDNGYPTFSD